MNNLRKIILKYWQFLIASIVILIGISISSTRINSEEKVLKRDLELERKSRKNIINSNRILVDEHEKEIKEIRKERSLLKKDALKQKESMKKELSVNSSNIDKILREKFNLKG